MHSTVSARPQGDAWTIAVTGELDVVTLPALGGSLEIHNTSDRCRALIERAGVDTLELSDR